MNLFKYTSYHSKVKTTKSKDMDLKKKHKLRFEVDVIGTKMQREGVFEDTYHWKRHIMREAKNKTQTFKETKYLQCDQS